MITEIKTITNPELWNAWLEERSYLRSRISTGTTNLRSHFLSLHGATEAALRQIIFIGLRKNNVNYEATNDWIFHNNSTPGKGMRKGDYIPLFNKLYHPFELSWKTMLESSTALSTHWDLWLGYSKIIRNHLAHSIREYTSEWLEPAVHIDKGLLYYLDESLVRNLGHSPFVALSVFSPRLPIVRDGLDPYNVTGTKKKQFRPNISLKQTKDVLEKLGYPVSLEK